MVRIVSFCSRRNARRSAAPISVLAIAIAGGLLADSRPARADCTYDAGKSAYICVGTSDAGIPTTPLLNNGKVQLIGGSQIRSPAVALTIGASNIVDSEGLIAGRDVGIEAGGDLIFNNTGEISGRGGAVIVSGGNLAMTNNNNVSSGSTAVNVSGHVKLTNSGSLSGLGGVTAYAIELNNSGSLKGAYGGSRQSRMFLSSMKGQSPARFRPPGPLRQVEMPM